MNVLDIINKAKNSKTLSEGEIRDLVKAYTNKEIHDYQMSAWLMAVCLNGLTEEETVNLTLAMRDSGNILDLSNIGNITADKHSTGGVGDKTSLIVGPTAAACGIAVPKMSGRGLGHTGGTIDKLESIKGYKTDIPFSEFEKIVKSTGFSIISQNEELCPADKQIYALRNSSGTVESIPLICASIMSKKLALNADCIVLDVKYGSGAFMKTREDAEKLGSLMEKIGTSAGKKCRSVITDMDTPLGFNIGNALEVEEAVDVLKGRKKGRLYDISMELSANMLELGGKGTYEECYAMSEEAVKSGKALDVLKKTIELQGGNSAVCDDTSLLPKARFSHTIRASRDVKVTSVNCYELGMVSLLLGAGRVSKEDKIDMTAGIVMECEKGDNISMHAPLLTLYSSVCSDFSESAVRAVRALGLKEI